MYVCYRIEESKRRLVTEIRTKLNANYPVAEFSIDMRRDVFLQIFGETKSDDKDDKEKKSKKKKEKKKKKGRILYFLKRSSMYCRAHPWHDTFSN